MKLSIITINLNNCSGLKLSINSLFSQSFTDFELVVVDGVSCDGSVDFIKSLKHQSISIEKVIEKDTGIYSAMNKGLNLATGDYIAFLNSGDYLAHSRVIEKLVTSGPDTDIGFGRVNFYNEADEIVRVFDPGVFKRWKLFFGWMSPHPMCVIKRSLVLSTGGFREDLRISADYELMLRLFLRDDLTKVYVPGLEVMMQSGGVSNGSLAGVFRGNIEVLKAWSANHWFVPFWIFILKPVSKLAQLKFQLIKAFNKRQ